MRHTVLSVRSSVAFVSLPLKSPHWMGEPRVKWGEANVVSRVLTLGPIERFWEKFHLAGK